MNPETVFLNLQKNRQDLSGLENIAVRCVLQKSSDKLKIIEGLMPGKQTPLQEIGYRPLKLKLQDIKIKVVPSDWKTAENLLATSQLKRVVSFLLRVFEETKEEIEWRGSYAYLDYTLCCENREQFDKIMSKQENRECSTTVQYLQEKIDSSKSDFERTHNFLLESTGPCLDQSLTNVYVQEKTAELHNLLTEQTCVEQNTLQRKAKENEIQQFIDEQDSDANEENRIHVELELHLTTDISELQKRLEYWNDRYNVEIERLDVDLLQTMSKMEELKKHREEILKEYNMKQEKILRLQAEFDEQERQLKRKRITVSAAVIIQRWWRRILAKRVPKTNSKRKQVNRNGKKTASKKK